MSVQKILIKNLKKSDKDFGQIAKMVLFYEQNQEFDENLFDEENITDFTTEGNLLKVDSSNDLNNLTNGIYIVITNNKTFKLCLLK